MVELWILWERELQTNSRFPSQVQKHRISMTGLLNLLLRFTPFGRIAKRTATSHLVKAECATVAQLVRALDCGSRGRRFKTLQSYHFPTNDSQVSHTGPNSGFDNVVPPPKSDTKNATFGKAAF